MFDVSKGTERARAWPRSRPTTRSKAQRAAEDKFYWAQMATKFMAPQILASVRKAVAGTALLPRDLLTSQLYNRLCYFALEDGTPRYPMSSIYQVSQSLDALGSTPGYVLVRGEQMWTVAPYLPQPDGGALVKVADFIAAGGETDIAWTALPLAFTTLEIDFNVRGASSTGTLEIFLRFNGDTGNNYDWKHWANTGTGTGGNQSDAQAAHSRIRMCTLPAADGPLHTATAGRCIINDPQGATFYKGVNSEWGRRSSTITSGFAVNQCAGWWRNQDPITEVNLRLPQGLAAGSRLTLYARQ